MIFVPSTGMWLVGKRRGETHTEPGREPPGHGTTNLKDISILTDTMDSHPTPRVRHRRAPKPLLGLGGTALSLVLVLTVGTVAWATGAFSAAVATASNTFSSATLQLEGTTSGSTNCYSTGTGSGGSVTTTNSGTCAGDPLPTATLSTTSATSSDTLTSLGTANPTSATVATTGCGVAKLADSASATDWSGTGPNTALPFSGVTYQASGPLSTNGIALNGSTGWAETTTGYTDPTNFTILAWFKTSVGQGSIAGFSDEQNPVTTTPPDHDRMLWVGTNGKLNWGIYDSAQTVLTSTSAVDTGSWVFAAATVGSSTATLYVNGTQVATSAVSTLDSYPGWWTIGYAALSGWTNAPSNFYFDGSLAQVAIIPSQLSSSQVTTLEGDSTLSTYTAGVTALSPANNWQLNDAGSTAYTGAVPGITTPTQTFADISGNNNTGTGGTGVTPNQAGHYTGQASTGFNATAQVTTTTDYSDNPSTFSLAGWFKSASSSGGSILGFSSGTTNGSVANAGSTIPIVLWMDNAGQIVFGVFSTTYDTVVSPSDYNNGAWHFVVASLGSGGMDLYIDGALVASSAGVTAQLTPGWWHVGWSGETYNGLWPNHSTTAYWNGSLGDVTVIPSQLSASQVTALSNAANGSAFTTAMMADTPTAFWPLDDSVTSGICAMVELTIQTTVSSTNTCAYPAGSGSCPAISATYVLSGLNSDATSVPLSGSAVTVSFTMKLTAAAPSGTAGLLVLPGLTFSIARTGWSAAVAYATATEAL